MIPPKIDFTIYQGTTFSRSFVLSEGSKYPISSITTGNPTTIEFTIDHDFQQDEYVLVIDAESIPLLSSSYKILSVTPNSITIDVSTTAVLSSEKAVVQKAANLTGYNFQGQIRQKLIQSLGNVLATTQQGNREVVLSGVTSLKVGDRVTIEDIIGLSDVLIDQTRTVSGVRQDRQILVLEIPATESRNQATITVNPVKLADFSFEYLALQGKVTASIPASITQQIPSTYDNRHYFYDLKYDVGGSVIRVLSYGNVSIVPQVTTGMV